MHLFDFHAKLTQLNSQLYVKVDAVTVSTTGRAAMGVWARKSRRSKALSQARLAEADTETRQYLDDESAGTKDVFLFAVPHQWVPEYDELDPVSGRVLARGWRNAVLWVVRNQFCTLEKARKLFGRSLGESTYDKLDYNAKLLLAKKELKNGRASRLLGR